MKLLDAMIKETERRGIRDHDDVERLIRVQRAGVIANRDIAETEDGQRYNIAMVQTVDGAYPPSLDLTLTRIK